MHQKLQRLNFFPDPIPDLHELLQQQLHYPNSYLLKPLLLLLRIDQLILNEYAHSPPEEIRLILVTLKQLPYRRIIELPHINRLAHLP